MSATMTVSKEAKRTPVPMNGIDTPALFGTINAVGTQPELGKFGSAPRAVGLRGHTARARCTAFSARAASIRTLFHIPRRRSSCRPDRL